MSRLRWVTSVACQGGPILLADAYDYPRWSGARRDPAFERTVRYWGDFVGELPAELRGTGAGDQVIECGSREEALAARDRLRDALLARWPDTVISEDGAVLTFARGDGKRLFAELGPASEYELACKEGLDRRKDAWVPRTGDARVLLWEVEGGGAVEVGRSGDGSEVLLSRTWASADREREEARAFAEGARDREQDEDEIEIPSGAAALVWAPARLELLDGVGGAEDLRRLAESGDGAPLGTELVAGCGTVLALSPGRYRAAVGRHEDAGGWSCRWCRLSLAA